LNYALKFGEEGSYVIKVLIYTNKMAYTEFKVIEQLYPTLSIKEVSKCQRR